MNKLDNNVFISKSNNIHHNKYDYSLCQYINSRTKVKIICSNHGIFEQTPNSHLGGRGCKKCGIINKIRIGKSFDDFVKEANIKHFNFYIYPSDQTKLTSYKVQIICPNHGEFIQNSYDHLRGSGCPQCSNVKKLNIDSFINKAFLKHNNSYNYNNTVYINYETKVKIECPIHGEFEQTPHTHLAGGGCPNCKNSKGENEIRLFLIENNIHFIPQYRIKNCRDRYPLPFDFYISELNMCVEFDGIQHFQSKSCFGGDAGFKDRQNKDNIKTDYCVKNNIKLLRIKYNDNIENKLNEILELWKNRNID